MKQVTATYNWTMCKRDNLKEELQKAERALKTASLFSVFSCLTLWLKTTAQTQGDVNGMWKREFEVGVWGEEYKWKRSCVSEKKRVSKRMPWVFSIFSVWPTYQPGSRAALCSQSPIGWFISPNRSWDDGTQWISLLGKGGKYSLLLLVKWMANQMHWACEAKPLFFSFLIKIASLDSHLLDLKPYACDINPHWYIPCE